jgi:ubiquinone/menaquinone biosynthesis C-methylase UbiE
VSFEILRQTEFWKCTECGLFQYGCAGSEEAYNCPTYHAGYEQQRRRKIRTAMVRLQRIAAIVHTPAPRLLDIGCGIGAVMEAATQRGWQATGADVSQAVVAGCQQRGLDCQLIADGRLPFPDRSFDIATAWSVIEHVEDVRQTLAEWRRVLKPGGILAMDTSNALCWKARLLGARYRHFWPHGHTYTFTPVTLGRFVREAGFRLVPAPFFGSLRGATWLQACYSLGYQLQFQVRERLRLQKPFMLFAERIEMRAGEQLAAA